MAEAFLPYRGIQTEKRPGLELFFSRALVFGGLFLFAEFLFLAQRHMPVWKCFLSWVLRFLLLILMNYHLIIGLAFKRLSYEILDDAIVIKSFPFNKKILLKEIKEIKEIEQNWVIKRKSLFAYAKEFPQVIHFIGQYGMFNVSDIGDVFLLTTLASYSHPERLILITTNRGKIFGISPERPKEFIGYLQERLKRFRGQL